MKMRTTSFLYHLALLIQTGLTEGSCEIDNCSPNSCDGHNCTLCDDGYYKDTFENCAECLIYCKDCGQDQCYQCAHVSCPECKYSTCHDGCGIAYCSICPAGYYLGSGARCYRCFYNNCKCSSLHDCVACLPGRYSISNFCRSTCLEECVLCKSISDCTECVPGKFGHSCQLSCTTTCQDGTCDKVSGNCFQGCANNQYLDSDGKCSMCFYRCTGCIEHLNCTTCKKSIYWGSYCQYDCLSCAGHCDKNMGCLSGCNAKYYRHYTATKQGYDCTRCPETCKSCTSSVDCIDCEIGYWGTYCQYNCTGCASECKKDDGCHSACNIKYFQQYNTVSQGYECLRCPDTCTSCTNSTYCIDCVRGYWGAYCQHNCTGCFSECRKDDGCDNRCSPGYYPHRVDNGYSCGDCSEHCKSCISATCNDCEHGYYVSNINNCTQCPNCISLSCDTKNGICIQGCIAGFSGNQCHHNCSKNCVQCNQFNSSSCTACKVGYYGDSCDLECKFCNQMKCFKNGTCKHGYVEGHKGLICDHKTDVPSSEQKDDSRNTLNVVLSIITAMAVLVAILLVTGIVILIRKGRLKFIHSDMNTSEAQRGKNFASKFTAS